MDSFFVLLRCTLLYNIVIRLLKTHISINYRHWKLYRLNNEALNEQRSLPIRHVQFFVDAARNALIYSNRFRVIATINL